MDPLLYPTIIGTALSVVFYVYSVTIGETRAWNSPEAQKERWKKWLDEPVPQCTVPEVDWDEYELHVELMLKRNPDAHIDANKIIAEMAFTKRLAEPDLDTPVKGDETVCLNCNGKGCYGPGTCDLNALQRACKHETIETVSSPTIGDYNAVCLICDASLTVDYETFDVDQVHGGIQKVASIIAAHRVPPHAMGKSPFRRAEMEKFYT